MLAGVDRSAASPASPKALRPVYVTAQGTLQRRLCDRGWPGAGSPTASSCSLRFPVLLPLWDRLLP